MTNFLVDNVNDSGLGSFRQAMLDANGAVGDDDITFDPSLLNATVTILSTIDIADNLTIDFDVDGDDAGDVTLFF